MPLPREERYSLKRGPCRAGSLSLLFRNKLQVRAAQTIRVRLLFVGALMVAGTVLLSCSGPVQNANGGTQATANGVSASAANPTPAAGAKSVPSATPNAAGNGVPKQQLAKPKNIIPAPTVAAGASGPRIAFANDQIDYGDITFDDVVQANFDFRNVGDKPLIISTAQVQVVQGC